MAALMKALSVTAPHRLASAQRELRCLHPAVAEDGFAASAPAAWVLQRFPQRRTWWPCSQLFESLPRTELESIASFVVLRKFAKGSFLFREGEITRGFFVVRSGAINVHRIGQDGREKTIHVFRAGESIAEATLADGVGYPAHAWAVEPAVVLFVPRTEFLDLLKQRPELALRMLSSMSQHLRVLVNALDDNDPQGCGNAARALAAQTLPPSAER